jgi:hypothetical protein
MNGRPAGHEVVSAVSVNSTSFWDVVLSGLVEVL